MNTDDIVVIVNQLKQYQKSLSQGTKTFQEISTSIERLYQVHDFLVAVNKMQGEHVLLPVPTAFLPVKG